MKHNANGETISNMASGREMHNGFMTKYIGKERFILGYGRADVVVNKTIIYELKPNNLKSIAMGIEQLKRYNEGLGGAYKLILVLY